MGVNILTIFNNVSDELPAFSQVAFDGDFPVSMGIVIAARDIHGGNREALFFESFHVCHHAQGFLVTPPFGVNVMDKMVAAKIHAADGCD